VSASSHRDLIVDQFTRQATPFSTAKTIANEEALLRLVEACGAGPADTVLDVACGGGLVACAFARVVRRVEGIDITPAMLERARALAAEKGLTNAHWRQGDVLPLPYPDASFTIVTSRFTFHHFQDPLGVLREMKRVCVPGGRIAVVDTDASAEPAKAAEFNRMERLRDPSHVRAMPAAELIGLFHTAGLPDPRRSPYELRDELENLLQRSFPNPGDDEKIRALFRASAADDRLGIPIRVEGDRIHYAYPVVVLVTDRPA
jgi:ubiquinone/menaquinone biosynthesis C-methylase UbiE